MQSNITNDPYTGLANAIILQAVKDYRSALKKMSRARNNKDAKNMKEEVERFFRSGWFGMLTQIDPEMLIRKLQEEVEE